MEGEMEERAFTDLSSVLAAIQSKTDKAMEYIKALEEEKMYLKQKLENKNNS